MDLSRRAGTIEVPPLRSPDMAAENADARARARADKKSKRLPVGRVGSLGARGDVSTGALRAQYLLGSTVRPAKSSGPLTYIFSICFQWVPN